MNHILKVEGDEYSENGALVYRYSPTITNRWRNPKPAFSVSVPSSDGYKTRACRLLADGLNATYSHRRGYTVSPTKMAKFLKLYHLGWDASVMTGKLWAPSAEVVS